MRANSLALAGMPSLTTSAEAAPAKAAARNKPARVERTDNNMTQPLDHSRLNSKYRRLREPLKGTVM
jgi:hypothetical protein